MTTPETQGAFATCLMGKEITSYKEEFLFCRTLGLLPFEILKQSECKATESITGLQGCKTYFGSPSSHLPHFDSPETGTYYLRSTASYRVQLACIARLTRPQVWLSAQYEPVGQLIQI